LATLLRALSFTTGCTLRALLVLVTVVVAEAGAQDRVPFPIPRLSGPVEIDGRVDEAAWLAIPPLPAMASFPVYGREPSERTEFRVAHDDRYLYVSGRMFDSDPDGIRVPSLRRDYSSTASDWLVLNLDTFMDRSTILMFGVTPAGQRTDAIVPDDAENGGNWGWDANWDAEATIDADGWSAEMRIPLSSLRFTVEDGQVVMGMTVWRNIARRNEVVSWPGIEPESGLWSVLKASRAQPVVLQGVQPLKAAYVTPYALSGPARLNRLNGDRTGFVSADDWTREVGLDVKLSPGSGWAVDLSLNTDFAQVEADDQQVNLTRFSLFFPERRLFFQERGELFDFALGGSDRLFYTRRIGLIEGLPARIYGGARATGRIGGWDVGLLNMQTAASGATNSENSGVLRLRRPVLNSASHAGGLVTSRIESGGRRSFAAGADALLNVGGSHYLSAAVATTVLEEDSAGTSERLFARIRWETRGLYGLGADVEVVHAGGDFQPTLGFLARGGHVRTTGSVGWGWRMPEGSAFLRQRVSADFGAYRRYTDGAIESAELRPGWQLETMGGHSLSVTGALRHEDVVRSFSIAPELSVPAGAYRFGSGRVAFTPSSAQPLRLSGSIGAGQFYDGTLVSTSLTPTWNASRHLEMSGTWQVNRIAFSERDQERVTQLGRLRTVVMLNTRTSAIALLQYNDATDAFLVNLRLRYNPAEGTDLYIVYNHGLNADRFGYDPVRPLTDNRSVLVKYSRTMRVER